MVNIKGETRTLQKCTLYIELSNRVGSDGIQVESRNLGVIKSGEDVGGDPVADDRHVAGSNLGHDFVPQFNCGLD